MSLVKKDNIIEEINGIKIPDPYRWLEDVDNPEVQNWISSHNKEVDEALKVDSFKDFSNELIRNFKVVNFSNPVPVQGRYFYTERQPDEDQAVLYMKKVTHFEFPWDDKERAKKFYQNVFNWKPFEWEQFGYTSWQTGPVDGKCNQQNPGLLMGDQAKEIRICLTQCFMLM